jgi:hypothetical protein
MTTLSRLRQLEQQATRGPWDGYLGGVAYSGGRFRQQFTLNTTREDAALIVELRNALPDLLAAIEAAQEASRVLGLVRHQRLFQSDALTKAVIDSDIALRGVLARLGEGDTE